jgi:hypothetical protein
MRLSISRKVFAVFFAIASFSTLRASHITVTRTPDGGIQPQVAVDAAGTAHLIYYKGADGGGDIFYARQKADEDKFSKPIKVNSRAGSAMAIGSIRGAQLEVGKNNRVHVIWNGGSGAEKVKLDGKEITPLVYTRMNDEGTGFEPERNLITYAAGLDGGSSIAADPSGNVYAFWHGRAPGAAEGEEGRAVFVSRSTDEGKTFRPEVPATSEKTGACGCCGMKALADATGAVYVLYRGALEMTDRSEVLLVSPKPGAPFKIVNKHRWEIATCPMSSAFLSPAEKGAMAAWETDGQIFYTTVDPITMSVGKIESLPTKTKKRHPSVTKNSEGETLVTWSEGTGWARGGTAYWRATNNKGGVNEGHGEELPVWGMVTGYAKPNGDFVVIY